MLTITRDPNEMSNTVDGTQGAHRFECRTCPYQFHLQKAYFERKTFTQKQSADIVGGADAWKNVDKTEVQCPREGCTSNEAFFMQVQIRSADEPMTSFFRCVACSREWRE